MPVDDTTSNVLQGSDTMALNFMPGDRVVCAFGEIEGLKGVLVASRTDGRFLIRIAEGMYVEVPRVYVQMDNP
jgi:hypothetical protein